MKMFQSTVRYRGVELKRVMQSNRSFIRDSPLNKECPDRDVARRRGRGGAAARVMKGGRQAEASALEVGRNTEYVSRETPILSVLINN